MIDPLFSLPSVEKCGLAVLDGGLATHLEDALGQDLSNNRLWSASLLTEYKEGGGTAVHLRGPRSIVQAHKDFMKVGSTIILTSTYQASNLAFSLAGFSRKEAEELLVRSVRLAERARQECRSFDRHLIALSLGPYGAALANGSEYTGQYHVPTLENPSSGHIATMQDMERFHYDRLEILARNEELWSKSIDLIAFETIPRLDEAIAARRALSRIRKEMARESKIAFTSFVFPNGKNLPYLHEGVEEEENMEKLLMSVLADERDSAPLQGVGINCTKPQFLLHLVKRMTLALQSLQRREMVHQKPYLFIYPDGGLVWDGKERSWRATDEAVQDASFSSYLGPRVNRAERWASQVLEAANIALTPTSTGEIVSRSWKAVIIGGCCKSTVEDVAALRKTVDLRCSS